MKTKYKTFEAVYCSGFLIDPPLVTALCLLFDKIHLLNHLEHVIAFSKQFEFVFQKSDMLSRLDEMMEIKPVDSEEEGEDPLSRLTTEQKRTARAYLALVDHFTINYHDLFGSVISSSLLPDDKVFDVKLIKKGVKGKLNLYRVEKKPLYVSTGGLGELDTLIAQGLIPVVGKHHARVKGQAENIEQGAVFLASILAMTSVKLVLPQTKLANGETILEARERLKDYLPPFWASMLRLSVELKRRIIEGMPLADLEKESADIFHSIVRPSLIELNQKLIKERKNWFHKIITPIANGLTAMIARPPVTTMDLISAGITLGANITINAAEQFKRIESTSQDSGLAYLIQLDEFVQKSD